MATCWLTEFQGYNYWLRGTPCQRHRRRRRTESCPTPTLSTSRWVGNEANERTNEAKRKRRLESEGHINERGRRPCFYYSHNLFVYQTLLCKAAVVWVVNGSHSSSFSGVDTVLRLRAVLPSTSLGSRASSCLFFWCLTGL